MNGSTHQSCAVPRAVALAALLRQLKSCGWVGSRDDRRSTGCHASVRIGQIGDGATQVSGLGPSKQSPAEESADHHRSAATGSMWVDVSTIGGSGSGSVRRSNQNAQMRSPQPLRYRGRWDGPVGVIGAHMAL